MRIGSLCTGYGGLDMAVQAMFGGELACNAMLKLLGNGVVPQQAEYALRQLVATAVAVDGLVAA